MNKINYKQDKGVITISTTVEADLHKEAKAHKISWARALEVGLSVILYQIDAKKYPLNKSLKAISNKVDKMPNLVDKFG